MPLEYWPHACSTAVYLINRLPTPTLNNESPFFKLFGNQPNYQKLRGFGCLCYPWVKPYNKHKLDPKSIPCVFVGYSSAQSAYYCLDPKTNKVYISRHVHFVESKFPFLDLAKITQSVPTLLEEWCPLSLPTSPSITHSSSETISPNHSTTSIDIANQHTPISSTDSQSQSTPTNSATNSNTSLSTSNEYTSASQSHVISPYSTPPVSCQPSHNMTTRLQNGIRKPITKLNLNAQVASPEIEPKSITQALKSPIWRKAMDEEVTALVRNKTWNLVQPSTSQNVIGCKWVF